MEEDLLIPISVLHDKLLTSNEKIYYATYLMHEKNIQVAEMYLSDFTKNQLKKAKEGLLEKGYITKKIYTENELKETTILESHKGKICEWCGNRCYILQKHHWPISAKNGGTKTVNICPNCHYTYHALEGGLYE